MIMGWSIVSVFGLLALFFLKLCCVYCYTVVVWKARGMLLWRGDSGSDKQGNSSSDKWACQEKFLQVLQGMWYYIHRACLFKVTELHVISNDYVTFQAKSHSHDH